MPSIATSKVCVLCTIRAKASESADDTPYIIIMLIMAKCHGPAPLGVGTTTAILPATKSKSPAAIDSPPVNSKQKKHR